jgi:hypothetical protein
MTDKAKEAPNWDCEGTDRRSLLIDMVPANLAAINHWHALMPMASRSTRRILAPRLRNGLQVGLPGKVKNWCGFRAIKAIGDIRM